MSSPNRPSGRMAAWTRTQVKRRRLARATNGDGLGDVWELSPSLENRNGRLACGAMAPRIIRRRWFRFSLRTLLALVVVTSIPLAWVGYSLNWIRERGRIERDIIAAEFGFPTAPGGLWLFGETGFGTIVCIGTPEDIENAKQLFPEAEVIDLTPNLSRDRWMEWQERLRRR